MTTHQVNMFDDCLSASAEKPKFEQGQILYKRELDIVKAVKVGRSWPCELKENGIVARVYHGYDTDHGVVWDRDIGDAVFFDEKSALEAAARTDYEKVYPGIESCLVTEWAGYEYIRRIDGYRLTATVAKIGEESLYESDFYCYSFLRRYPSRAARDKKYNEMRRKIREESEKYEGRELAEPIFESPLYKVKDVYASHGYALHHLGNDWR